MLQRFSKQPHGDAIMSECKYLARGLDASFYCTLKKKQIDPMLFPCFNLESERKGVCYK
jgi:hypothetical protein